MTRWRNGEHGYGLVTKVLHWLTVALLSAQVVVWLLVIGPDDLVAVHVAAQLLLLAVVVIHVGLVLAHTVVRRHRHLSRMV